MTVNNSRSKRGSLVTGTMEGKYIEPRPATEVGDPLGDYLTRKNRAALRAENGYGNPATPPVRLAPGDNR